MVATLTLLLGRKSDSKGFLTNKESAEGAAIPVKCGFLESFLKAHELFGKEGAKSILIQNP